jgi:hypothetical protein
VRAAAQAPKRWRFDNRRRLPACVATRFKECTMNNRIHSTSALLSGAVALAFAAGAAVAAPPQAAQQDPMAKQPTDQMMAQTSSMSAAQAKFDLLDANHNGSIDKQEAAVSKALTAEFSKIDANNDGKLSLTEFATVKDLASIKVDNKSGGY